MCPLTPEELRRISENNPTIRRLRERNERRKELLRKTLELKKDNEDLAWKVFCLHRKGAIHRDFIVGPILEDLVKNIGTFGHRSLSPDFPQQAKNNDIQPFFEDFSWTKYLDKNQNYYDPDGDTDSYTGTEVSTISSQFSEVFTKDDADHSTKVLSLMTERLTFNEPKGITKLRAMLNKIKEESKLYVTLGCKQNLAVEEPPVTTLDVIRPLVTSLIDRAFFRGKIRQARAQGEAKENLDGDDQSEEFQTENSQTVQSPDETRSSTFILTNESNVSIDEYEASESEQFESGSEYQHSRYYNDSDNDHKNKEEFYEDDEEEENEAVEVGPFKLSEKIDRYFASIEPFFQIQLSIEEDATRENEKEEPTICITVATQTDDIQICDEKVVEESTLEAPIVTQEVEATEAEEVIPSIITPKVLWIYDVPTSLNTVSKVAAYFEKYGRTKQVEVHEKSGGFGNVVCVLFRDEEACENALKAEKLQPLGKPWLSTVVKAEIGTQRDISLVPREDLQEKKKLFDFLDLLYSTQQDFMEKRSDEEFKWDISAGDYQVRRNCREKVIVHMFMEMCKELTAEQNLGNLKSLFDLAGVFDNGLKESRILRSKTFQKLDNTLDTKLLMMVLEMSYNQELDRERLVSLYPSLDESWYQIIDNWIKIRNGEKVQESDAIISCRYDILIKLGQTQEALALVKMADSAQVYKKYIFATLSEIEKNAKDSTIIDGLYDVLGLCIKTIAELFSDDWLERILKAVPEARKSQCMSLLLEYFGETMKGLELIATQGTIDDNRRAINIIEGKFKAGNGLALLNLSTNSSQSEKLLLDTVFDEIVALHYPDLADQAFGLSLEILKVKCNDWSMGNVIKVLRFCKLSAKYALVVQALIENGEAAIELGTIQKLIEGAEVAEKPQLAEVIVEYFNPILPFFDFLSEYGDCDVGIRILCKLNEKPSEVWEHGLDPGEVVKQMMERMLPRYPVLQKPLFELFLKLFRKEPNVLQRPCLGLFKSEHEMMEIIYIIEEKTMGNQTWTANLKSIVNDIAHLAKENTWNRVGNSVNNVILEQFSINPSEWTFHLVSYGEARHIVRACTRLMAFLRTPNSNPNQLANIFGFIKHLVSQIRKWNDASQQIGELLEVYFEVTKLSLQNCVQLFEYHSYWRQNRPFFTHCLKQVYRKMNAWHPVNDWPLLLEVLVKIPNGDPDFIGILTRFIKGLNDYCMKKVSEKGEQKENWKRSVDEMPSCINLAYNERGSGRRCDGCLQLRDFLDNDREKQRNITVNQTYRRCITRVLETYVHQNTRRVPYAAVIHVEHSELDCHQNRARFRSRNCGCILVTKKAFVDEQSRTASLQKYHITINKLLTFSNRLQAQTSMMQSSPLPINRVSPAPSSTVTRPSESSGTPVQLQVISSSDLARLPTPPPSVSVQPRPTTSNNTAGIKRESSVVLEESPASKVFILDLTQE